MEEKIQKLTEELEVGIKGIFEDEDYKRYLRFCSSFHSYSFGNAMLIMLQRPDATYVAGYKTWQNKHKRQVRKGEKGIAILAPAPFKMTTKVKKKDENGKEVYEEREVESVRFRVTHVFDISQTDGEPVPALQSKMSQAAVENYEMLFDSLKIASPHPITFEKTKGDVKGYWSPSEKKIVIKTGMSQAENIKVALHEITHADLHAEGLKGKTRETAEVEAESVAYIVSNYLNIESDYSFAYIATWSSGKELKELKASLQAIQTQAAHLIARIESKYQELQEQYRQQHEEMLDTVRFDNDIDLDKEKTREQLGFKDNDQPVNREKKKKDRSREEAR